MRQLLARLLARPPLLLGLIAYAVSFFLPTFDKMSDPGYGWQAFVISLLSVSDVGLFGPWLFVSWWANPAFWAGAVFIARGGRRGAISAAALAVLLGMPFVFRPLIQVGYYVWLGSMGLLLWAALETPQAPPRK